MPDHHLTDATTVVDVGHLMKTDALLDKDSEVRIRTLWGRYEVQVFLPSSVGAEATPGGTFGIATHEDLGTAVKAAIAAAETRQNDVRRRRTATTSEYRVAWRYKDGFLGHSCKTESKHEALGLMARFKASNEWLIPDVWVEQRQVGEWAALDA